MEKEYLTKEEAMNAMSEGKKVTHRFFSNDEWMTVQGGKVLLEDGVTCDAFDFWRDRQGDAWADGYSLFKTN